MSELLKVTDLVKHFPVREMQGLKMVRGDVRAVDGVSFTVDHGQTLGLVGESGCGKSTTSRLITRLLEPTSGSILFEGNELAHAERGEAAAATAATCRSSSRTPTARSTRGTRSATILSTPLRVHGLAKGREKQRVQELLELVGLNPEHINRYPNEFSGGQRQRIGIARALAVRAQADHRRRAGLRPRRLHPGPGDEPPRHPAPASSTWPSSSSPTTSASCATSATGSR